ncbi:hypothetical protein [Bdellovibrio sp. HCB209]|uniref:hypothetical protein n=1 Tax=Bdellovibrio sp. HCB209 TaxID=3394354 RepID=UPI0039B3B717
MFRSDLKSSLIYAFTHSKWALALLILVGLVYFEVRLNEKTLADNRQPATTTTSLTQ